MMVGFKFYKVIILNVITILTDITIGFASTAYTVNEDQGEIEITVEVKDAIALKKEISLNITTRDGSATGRLTS